MLAFRAILSLLSLHAAASARAVKRVKVLGQDEANDDGQEPIDELNVDDEEEDIEMIESYSDVYKDEESSNRGCLYPVALSPYQLKSSVYSVQINGKEIPTEIHLDDYHVARLSSSCSSDHEVVIRAPEKITSFTISPMSQQYVAESNNDELKISLPKLTSGSNEAHYLVVRMNLLEVLVITMDAYSAELDKFHPGGRSVLDVTDYGADPSGGNVEDTTKAIQKAMDEAGGGKVVYVPPGYYRVSSTLTWYSHSDGAELFLDPGSVIRTTSNRSLMKYNEGTDCWTMEPFMKFYRASDITIRGRGTLDANNFKLMKEAPKDKANDKCTWVFRRMMFDSDNRRAERQPKNIIIEGITVKDTSKKIMMIHGVDRLQLKNIKFLNHKNSTKAKIQNGGIIVETNSNSLARKNLVITQDDAICLKASYEQNEFQHFNPSTVNNTFEYNMVWTGCTAFKYGIQNRNPMENSICRGLDIIQARRALVVAGNRKDGGQDMGPNLTIVDTYVEKLVKTVDEYGNEKNTQPIQVWAETGDILDVTISGVVVRKSAKKYGKSEVKTKGKYSVVGLTFKNITFDGEKCTDFESCNMKRNGIIERVKWE